MTEQNEYDKISGIQRYFIASQRTSSLRLITFDELKLTRHDVRYVNLSITGIGIRSDEFIVPGLACFEEQVGGHKFGVVTWCRQSDDGYRAGIHFVTLARKDEKYLLKQIKLSASHNSIQDPDKIIARLFKSIEQDMNQ